MGTTQARSWGRAECNVQARKHAYCVGAHTLIVTSNVHLLHCLDFSNPLRGFLMYPVGIENSIFRLVIKRKKQVGCTCMHVCKQFWISYNVCTHIEKIVKLFIERKYFFIMISIFFPKNVSSNNCVRVS